MRERHATRLEGEIPILLLRLSVSRENKYPQVGFMSVWKGERVLPWQELLGRLAPPVSTWGWEEEEEEREELR